MLQLCKFCCKYVIRHYHTTGFLQQYNINYAYNEFRLKAMQQKKTIKSLYTYHYGAKLKIIGSGAPGTPAFLYLLTDLGNYLFNCGEATQRLSQEYHCKLSKIDNIFITHASWKNVGGLPGLLLTAQDNGLDKVNIHGSESIKDFMNKITLFTNYPNLKMSFPYENEKQIFKDKVLTVTYVELKKTFQNVEECSTDSVNETQYHLNENGKRFVDVEVNESNEKDVKKIKDIPQVICYICKLHPRAGKLLMAKCIEYGVSPGPICNRLKQGQDVTMKDGRVVFSKDVCLPPSPGAAFLVVDCPTEEYVDSLINNPTFFKYQEDAPLQENIDVLCILHFTPEEILITDQYQDWMKKFPAKSEHVILNEKNTCMGSQAVHKYQSILNAIHPEIFPLLNKEDDKELAHNGTSIHRARAIQTLTLRPSTSPLTTSVQYSGRQKTIEEMLKLLPNLNEMLENLKENIEKRTTQLDLNNVPDYPRIVMLGTGCSVPSKIRNTSGILLRITEDSSMILDCGEGTLGQITRFYGLAESDNILRSIKAIYVSHMHADHHLGVIGLLLRRKRLTKDPLYLLVPETIIPWLNFYNDQFEPIAEQYILLKNSNFYFNHHRICRNIENKVYESLNVKDISTIYVAHCKQSYGIAITLKNNKKIVYSGDTMFSQNLILLGKDCDLLIHEATMETGLEEVAKRKLHSTTAEAISVGQFMNAKFTLLTHFSQRYGKMPTLAKCEKTVGIAYDNMQFKLPQLSLFDLFYPCLETMFDEAIELDTIESDDVNSV